LRRCSRSAASRVARSLVAWLASGTLFAACAGSSPGGTASDAGSDAAAAPLNLLAVDRFVVLEPSSDPNADHRPMGCALGTPRVEDETLELETDDCLLHWVGVPLTDAVKAGERLRLVRTHSALAARVPADAHLRIDLEGDVILERTIPIPSADAIDVDTVTPTRDHAAGSLLRVHLHNHGANNWRLVALRR
jgi:hypothetical protein